MIYTYTYVSDGKESTCNAGDPVSIPGSGRSPGEGNGCYPLQYSCLENPMDRGAWRTAVHSVAKSQTWLSDRHFHFDICVYTQSISAYKYWKPWFHFDTFSFVSIPRIFPSLFLFLNLYLLSLTFKIWLSNLFPPAPLWVTTSWPQGLSHWPQSHWKCWLSTIWFHDSLLYTENSHFS